MIDEVTSDVPDSYQRWRDDADRRLRLSRERRARETARLMPREWRQWATAVAIAVVMLALVALVGVVGVVPR